MVVIKVVGTTYDNRDESMQHVIESYKGKPLKGIAKLQKEPDNPHDPKAIKVLCKDKKGDWFHIGYVPREDTGEVAKGLKDYVRIDVEVKNGEYLLHPMDVVEYVEGNKILSKVFVEPSKVTKKGKTITRIGQAVVAASLLIIILIFIIV